MTAAIDLHRALSPSDVERFAPLVRRIAMRLARRLPDHISVDDLMACGWVGLAETFARRHAGMSADEIVAAIRTDNLARLTPNDQVKFVICSRADYEWARGVLAEHALERRCDVLFSPSKSEVDARSLADWIVADRLPVRFQMQLHKILWNDEPGR